MQNCHWDWFVMAPLQSCTESLSQTVPYIRVERFSTSRANDDEKATGVRHRTSGDSQISDYSEHISLVLRLSILKGEEPSRY